MKYFELLPLIEYNNRFQIRNLNYKYYFLNDVSPEYLSTYTITDGDTLESIALDFYEDSSLWWLLAILNGIKDVIFDLPLEEEIIQSIARDNATTDDILDEVEYLNQYELLIAENDLKRTIRVFKPEFIQKVLTEVIRQVS